MGIVRLFLALVVVADHWRAFILVPAGTGAAMSDTYKLGFNAGYAVMFFYAISGFLITYTLSKNYQPGWPGVSDFYRKRFIRIFSLYWPLVVLAFLSCPEAWPRFVAADMLRQITSIFLIGMDWQIAFGVPGTGIWGLTQAWTLAAELTFYLSAPILMRSWKVGAALLLLSLGFRLSFVVVNGPAMDPQWTYAFPVSTFCFFMLGHLICLASQKWRALQSASLGGSMVVVSGAAMLWAGNYADFDGWRFWLSMIFFTLALPGLFGATMRVGWMNALGDLSYPVYMVHFLPFYGTGVAPLVLELATAHLGANPYTSTACFLVLMLVWGFAAHHLLERPVAYLMRKVLIRPAAATAA